jgi:uncharacterized membrane protein YhfC
MEPAPFPFRPAVFALLALSGLVTLLGPFVLAFVWKRRTGARWAHFGIGALTFFVSQIVLRLPWQVPLGLWLAPRLTSIPAQLAWAAASALTAALFEEVGRWAAYRWIAKGARAPRDGAMLGIGHGGIESTLLIGVTLSSTAALYALLGAGVKIPLPPEAMAQLSALGPSGAAAGGVERILTVPLHVAMSMLVLQCFVRGRHVWLLIAIGAHFAVDFFGVLGAQSLGAAAKSPLVGEAALVPFTALSIWIWWRLMKERTSKPWNDTMQ